MEDSFLYQSYVIFFLYVDFICLNFKTCFIYRITGKFCGCLFSAVFCGYKKSAEIKIAKYFLKNLLSYSIIAMIIVSTGFRQFVQNVFSNEVSMLLSSLYAVIAPNISWWNSPQNSH